MTLEIVTKQETNKLVPLKTLPLKSLFRRKTKKSFFIKLYDPMTLNTRTLSLSSGNMVDISLDEFVIPVQARLVEI